MGQSFQPEKGACGEEHYQQNICNYSPGQKRRKTYDSGLREKRTGI